MELNFSLVKSFAELGALVVLAYLYVKEKSTDSTNKEIMGNQKVKHKELMTGIENLSIEINKLICVLSGKFVNKENFIDTVSLRFRDIQLNLDSKVDKNNIVKNYEEIFSFIDFKKFRSSVTDEQYKNITVLKTGILQIAISFTIRQHWMPKTKKNNIVMNNKPK